MNFGTILNSVTKKCVKLMVESNDETSKSLARDFIKYVQIKEVLKKQFRVYQQLNSSYIKNKDSAKTFVNETLSILDEFEFEDILSYNHLLETRFDVNKMKSSDINLDISKLIKYRTSSEKTDQLGFVTSLNNVIEYVSTFKDEKNMLSELGHASSNSELKFLQPKHVVRIALKKFNSEYGSQFDREDVVVFNTLREGNETKLHEMYNNKVEELNVTFKSVSKILSEDLSKKVNFAMGKISSGYTQENLLDVHELVSELKILKEE